ncbi:MAG: lipoyl synthase [Candidatus Xenolissoclinum pacificiensis L6]|uniref:Lipoyl synthase n=1 Tax=Candidatus Xenolissoclinum pacificiensis L6 TaxID=1401685 RepID=W2UYZ6_9RICK|nr:MAG: lipoyl synthase [Candidatus Xenolissoclinum pacificiensis L6]
MILGNICTRACRFCNVATGVPGEVDGDEPKRLAFTVQEMNLKHVVITSVDRDDLVDGGAEHFAKCIKEIRRITPDTTIEVLTPDFLNKGGAESIVIDAFPDVFNHNVETVPRLYRYVRPKANYFNSLSLLHKVKLRNQNIFTKSGFMLGLGETETEVKQLLDDLKNAKIDFVTIGQYLQPTPKHASVEKYYSPEEFNFFKSEALKRGFLMVSSSPLTRSSYHADEDFKILQSERMSRNSTLS